VSDIALKRPLPPELAQGIMAYVGCIAGAVLIEDYERALRAAGFEAVQVVDTGKDLNVYGQVGNPSGCCSPAMTAGAQPAAEGACCGPAPGPAGAHDGLVTLLGAYNVNDYAASVQVYALKGR
jgi:hypothetical protein